MIVEEKGRKVKRCEGVANPGEGPPSPPPFLRVWMTGPLPLSQGLDLAL